MLIVTLDRANQQDLQIFFLLDIEWVQLLELWVYFRPEYLLTYSPSAPSLPLTWANVTKQVKKNAPVQLQNLCALKTWESLWMIALSNFYSYFMPRGCTAHRGFIQQVIFIPSRGVNQWLGCRQGKTVTFKTLFKFPFNKATKD